MVFGVLKRMTQLSVPVHGAMAVVSLGWFQWTKGLLDASYAASGHPVDYMTGQTSFSGEVIKGYYAAMSQAGTLDVYVTTQMIDFAFILGFVGIGLLICTLIARLGRADSIARKAGLFAGAFIVLGALCDMIENAWSFVMLANPSGFADWLALPYSSFAVLKFGCITLGMVCGVACIALAVVGRVLRKPNVG